MACVVDAASEDHAEEENSSGEDEELAAADNAVFVDLRRHSFDAPECGDYIL